MKIALIGLLFTTLLLQAASFEVATIKPASPDEAGYSGADGRDGLLKMWNVTLKQCIGSAYKIPEGQILEVRNGSTNSATTSLPKPITRPGNPNFLRCFHNC